MNDIKVEDLVDVIDDSYSMIIKNNKLIHPYEPGGWLQNRNPWKVVAFISGLPTDYSVGLEQPTPNDVIVISKGQIAFTRRSFIKPHSIKCPYCGQPTFKI